MAKFKESLSALGFFWPEDKPQNSWPGSVSIETFPRARLHWMGVRPGDGSQPLGRMTIHGITESNEYITMLEASGTLDGIAFNSQSATEGVVITANYMLVGAEHFDDSPTVRRLRFSSAVAEHVFRLWARPDYKEIRHRRVGGSQDDRPILRKQVASYSDLDRGFRVRLLRSTVPNTMIEPTSLWTIDFLKLATPRHAVRVLHEFRSLLALICGDLIDLWDVQLDHRQGADRTSSALYFADPVKRPTKSDSFPTIPMLDIAHDRELFRRIIAGWLADTHARRICRGAFHVILQDKGTLRFGHLRELVTIIEMQASNDGIAPLPKAQSCALRAALKTTLKQFVEHQPHSVNWFETIEKRINNINYHDAKILLNKYISQLPRGLVSVSESFHRDVIDFRNTLVHDISRVSSDDYNKLAYFVAKLKALYALSDALELGARPDEVRAGSRVFSLAEHTPSDVFTAEKTKESGG
jgi:hypothetical protein